MESFISTQKFSVQRELQRRFRQFLVSREDFHHLLLELLRGLLRDERREEQLRAQTLQGYKGAEELQIACRWGAGRACAVIVQGCSARCIALWHTRCAAIAAPGSEQHVAPSLLHITAWLMCRRRWHGCLQMYAGMALHARCPAGHSDPASAECPLPC